MKETFELANSKNVSVQLKELGSVLSCLLQF